MAERKVAVLLFPYYVDQYDPSTDTTRRVELLARSGEVIDFADYDVKRGERLGAFFPEDHGEEGEGEVEFDPATATPEDLKAWVEEDHPSVKTLVEASGGDPALARRLLQAETDATGNDARKGVTEGLGAVIARG